MAEAVKTTPHNTSRSRLACLAVNSALLAIVAGLEIPGYVKDWEFVSTRIEGVATILGAAAWGLACVLAAATALLCLVKLPGAPRQSDSLRAFHWAIYVEIGLVFFASLILDGGAIQRGVIFGSLLANFAMLLAPWPTSQAERPAAQT